MVSLEISRDDDVPPAQSSIEGAVSAFVNNREFQL